MISILVCILQMNVSRTIAILLLLSACLVSANGEAVRFDGFEGRRPIKYFFHLLELKSDFNPLLYSTTSNTRFCSSKSGPFCQIAGHVPLKTHEIRQPTIEMSNMRAQLLQNVKYAHQTYQSVERSQNQMFLIRTGLLAAYELNLKNMMGEMSRQQMLDSQKFKDLLLQ